MSIGNKLAEARKRQNLTQEQLAERLGVTRQAVSRWESDAAYPETDKIVRMARLLGVSCDYLLRDDIAVGDAGAPPPEPVTRLLRQAAGRKVRVALFDGEGIPGDWCVILDFDGSWANIEVVKKKGAKRETQLVPLSSIRSITFLKEEP